MAGDVTKIGEPGRWIAVIPALDESTCDRIVARCRSLDATTPEVVGEETVGGHRAGTTRRIARGPAVEDLYQLIWDLGEVVNRRYFQLELLDLRKPPEYVEYPSGKGHFHWHDDYGLERPVSRRKLTLSLQLSHPDEYEGGDFEVSGTPEPLPRARGALLAMPAYVTHRVTPVTAGTRRALIAWLAGPALR